jgi:hypothetical protein
MRVSANGDRRPKKSFWRNAWDVLGFTLAIYAVIAVAVVGTIIFLVIADR